MNMTGDPNQRNKPGMFGAFQSSYPSPTLNLARFNEGLATVSSTTTEDPSQCLFATNSSSPFSINTSFETVAEARCSAGYLFPSTSFVNVPSGVNRFSFPFSQAPAPAGGPRIMPEGSTHTNSPQISYPFQGTHFNWSPNMKPTFTLDANASHLPSTSNGITSRPLSGTFGCKRKTESPPLPPLKQHITEERMAEHMSRLHISSQTPTSFRETQPARERRLYMCEEMQRLQAESIIPAQLLERVSRPCTALVPWRPPVVPPLPKENNNNEEEPDNNLTERSQGNVMDMDS